MYNRRHDDLKATRKQKILFYIVITLIVFCDVIAEGLVGLINLVLF
jgi:hypothetical protein